MNSTSTDESAIFAIERPAPNLFTYYLKKPGYREELVRLLQGNVYDADDLTVLDRLREDIRRIESTPDHVMREGLSDIPI